MDLQLKKSPGKLQLVILKQTFYIIKISLLIKLSSGVR